MSSPMGTTRLVGLVLVALLIACGGCASSGSSRGAEASDRAKERRRTVIMTTQDNVRVGREAAEQVAAEIGTLDDPELVAYVERIGKKLLRGLPRRDFAYRFAIVDQMEPNAFALPGGYIFVSRGLLALANNEDELANVIGHEIIHAFRRHAQQQQAVAASLPGLSMPWTRAKTLAAYGRDMEREADERGQRQRERREEAGGVGDTQGARAVCEQPDEAVGAQRAVGAGRERAG